MISPCLSCCRQVLKQTACRHLRKAVFLYGRVFLWRINRYNRGSKRDRKERGHPCHRSHQCSPVTRLFPHQGAGATGKSNAPFVTARVFSLPTAARVIANVPVSLSGVLEVTVRIPLCPRYSTPSDKTR